MIPVYMKFVGKRCGGIFGKYVDGEWYEVSKVTSEQEYNKFVRSWRKLHIFATQFQFSYGAIST